MLFVAPWPGQQSNYRQYSAVFCLVRAVVFITETPDIITTQPSRSVLSALQWVRFDSNGIDWILNAFIDLEGSADVFFFTRVFVCSLPLLPQVLEGVESIYRVQDSHNTHTHIDTPIQMCSCKGLLTQRFDRKNQKNR